MRKELNNEMKERERENEKKERTKRKKFSTILYFQIQTIENTINGWI